MIRQRFLFPLLTLYLLTNIAWGQLPPSLHRISKVDTAVDWPEKTVGTVDSCGPGFGTAYFAKNRGILLQGDPALNHRPLTVELWAKIDSAQTFNVLLAHEPKDSPRHWELYTYAGSGDLALYLPGNGNAQEIRTGTALADGRWHYIALVLDSATAELYVDGRRLGQAPIVRADSPTPEGTLFAIGSLVERGLACNGAIDELRISSGRVPVESIPQEPFRCEDNTLLLAHFDLPAHGNEASPLKFPLSGKLAAKNSHFAVDDYDAFSRLFPKGGLEIDVKPGDKPPKNIPTLKVSPERFAEHLRDLKLRSIKADEFRDGVFANWGEQFVDLEKRISGETPLPRGAAGQVYDAAALILPEEKHPASIVLRQSGRLLESLRARSAEQPDSEHAALAMLHDDWTRLNQHFAELKRDGKPLTPEDYFAACGLRRKIVFADSRLREIDRILFLARGSYSGSRLTNASNNDRIGGHFATQNFGFNTIRGGGLFAISGWRETHPTITNLTEGRKIAPTATCNRLAGRELDYGSFMSPDLSFDGKTLYFAHCGSQEHRWVWTPDTSWNLFKMQIDGREIEQLTDGPYNDFDPCELPSGRIAFISERRGGFIRCFGEDAALRVTTYVLHSLKPDGSDVYPISFFETSEWQPSVDNSGMLVYTRWDYTDRENCLGSQFWTCAPDGRNPRAPHGNYPLPHHTFPDNTHGDHRFGNCPDAPSALPLTEMQIRAIPNSHRYVLTAAPHHGETYGSLCILDLREKDDNHMSQLRRITPYVPFPESESPGRGQYRYSAPWPLDEDVFLCNSWEDLVVLDRFGNEELLCEREILPIGYDPRLRLSEPIPLRPRPVPPLIPQQTTQGEDFADADHTATVGIINVNIADLPLPQDRPIKRLRVLQVIPKPNPWMDTPWIGYATENTPRIPLGTVPVEEDGSVYFEAPSGKQLIYQILDEHNRAVQTMRAVSYVHPGERLVCTGCHEPTSQSAVNPSQMPLAFRRAPSKLEPECGPIEPVNYYRLIKPILDETCNTCHQKEQKGPQNLGYEELRPYVYYFAGGLLGTTTMSGLHGGSRSIPGRIGAGGSRLTEILFDENHRDGVSDEERGKFILWMDANVPRLGAFQNEEAQKRGELVWPILDVDATSR